MFLAEAMTWPDTVACVASMVMTAFIVWCVTRGR